MEGTLKTLREMPDARAEEYVRGLYETDRASFGALVAELTRAGGDRDCELIAIMLTVVPIASLRSDAESVLYIDPQINEYFRLCEQNGLTVEDCFPTLFAAQYAPKKSKLSAWDKSVDKFIRALARKDFEGAAALVDSYDPRYGKYNALIDADKPRALERLVALALYGKGVNRSAIRDILMDYVEISGFLMSLYKKVSAHERVAVVRLLLVYKNDANVRHFIKNTVANDRSKCVRELVDGSGIKSKKRCSAAADLESLMSEGKPLTLSEWNALLEDEQYAAAAERIFFYTYGPRGETVVLVFDGGWFFNSNDDILRDPEAQVYVLHPLDLPDDPEGFFSASFNQPFLQINRPIFSRRSGEFRASERLDGTIVESEYFYEQFKKLGFVFASRRTKNEAATAVCAIGEYTVGVQCFVAPDSQTVTCGRIYFYRSSDIVKLGRSLFVSGAEPIAIPQLPDKTFSELMYKVHILFDSI